MKRVLFIVVTITLIVIAFLYVNEQFEYQKQSQIALNRLSNEMIDEMDIVTKLLYTVNSDSEKSNTESKFNELIMEMSNVIVLLEVSRYGKGVSESESEDMLELMTFHEYLLQEFLTMSFQFSENGTLTEYQHNDIKVLRELFFDIRGNLLKNDGKTDGFNIWYTTIIAYKDEFSDTGLISNYYQ